MSTSHRIENLFYRSLRALCCKVTTNMDILWTITRSSSHLGGFSEHHRFGADCQFLLFPSFITPTVLSDSGRGVRPNGAPFRMLHNLTFCLPLDLTRH